MRRPREHHRASGWIDDRREVSITAVLRTTHDLGHLMAGVRRAEARLRDLLAEQATVPE